MSPRLPLALLVLTLATATARADGGDEHRRPAAGAVVGHLGAGTPHGVAGLGAEVTIYELIRIEAGVGLGIEGHQLAVLASGLFGPDRGIGLGVGLSRGAYRWEEIVGVECDDTCDARVWDAAEWVNLQLSYRHRFGSRWQVGPYVGVSLMLNPDDHTCPDEDLCGTDGDGERLYFVGVAGGVSFGN